MTMTDSPFQPPADQRRYRQCFSCREMVDREKVEEGRCPACGKPVAREMPPPFDEIHDRTGAELPDCREALEVAGGDVEAAIAHLHAARLGRLQTIAEEAHA